MTSKQLAIVYDAGSKAAHELYISLMGMYNFLTEKDILTNRVDIIITIGGDGLMLKALHRYKGVGAKFYGINRGSVGFLMNPLLNENLIDVLQNTQECKLAPLEMVAENIYGERTTQLAINEVSLLRETNQACKLKILVNGKICLDGLVSDGILVSTPAGSTAYNFAANGPILPLNANLLCLTPIAAFRPRRWQGALLDNFTEIQFENLDPYKRPVSASADFHEFREAKSVSIRSRPDLSITLLFNKDNKIEDRLLEEMFNF